MGLKRNVSLSTALGYKGEGPYLTFILHRIGGSALFIFFTLYILSLLGIGFASTIFSNWVFQIILLVFGLFHAINGLRITILDLFPKLIEHYRKVFPNMAQNPLNQIWMTILAKLMVIAFVLAACGHGVHGVLEILDDYFAGAGARRRSRNIIITYAILASLIAMYVIWTK